MRSDNDEDEQQFKRAGVDVNHGSSLPFWSRSSSDLLLIDSSHPAAGSGTDPFLTVETGKCS